MKQYRIKEAFQLQSHPQKLLLQPGQFYATDKAEELKELEQFAKDGSCEIATAGDKRRGLHLASEEDGKVVDGNKNAQEGNDEGDNQNPEEDITVVPGIGNTLKQKLEAAGVTTVSELEEAMESRTDEMEELLGNSFEKVRSHFA
jgi:predicted flap endonuclease-1-like 5' DNA nuclease